MIGAPSIFLACVRSVAKNPRTICAGGLGVSGLVFAPDLTNKELIVGTAHGGIQTHTHLSDI